MTDNNDKKCEFCGKKFTSQYNLKVHIETAKYCLKLRDKNVAKGHECDYCHVIFTQRSVLNTHLLSCTKLKEYNRAKNLEECKKLKETAKKLKTENDDLQETQLIHLEIIDTLEKTRQQDIDTIESLTAENEKLKTKIVELKETVAYSRGYVKGYQNVKPAKQITNNTTNNTLVQKLEALPITTIEPFTISLIKNNLENYTYKMYKRAELGVVDFITDLTILEMDDGTIEKNYVSSDRSRNAFHRLVVGKKWKSDGGANFLNVVLDQLIPKVDEYYTKLLEEMSSFGIRETMKDVLFKLDMELKPFFYGVTGPKSKERIAVLSKIRSVIKNNNHIDVLSIEQ